MIRFSAIFSTHTQHVSISLSKRKSELGGSAGDDKNNIFVASLQMSCSGEMAFFHSNFMMQTPHEDDHIHPASSTPLQEFHGAARLLRKRSSVCEQMDNEGEDESSDDGSKIGEKKRRLNMEQVKTLEKNFEVGNKLEPERKMQLARALGLEPRQIAIWFQNRRARWKTKQLENDYHLLKRQFEAIKAENDSLQAQNHKLHAQIIALKAKEATESINLNKETEASCSNRSENSTEIKLDISTTRAIDSPLSNDPNRSGQFGPSNSNAVAPLCPKMKQSVKEESLGNMFCGMDDQTGFWPWLEQQNFN